MFNEIQYTHLHGRLRIDKDALDDELVEQPQLFFEVAEQFALAASELASAKDAVKTIMARAYKSIRAKAEAKMSEGQTNAAVDANKRVRAARKTYHQAIFSEGRWGALKDAYGQRAWILKDLVQLHIRAYFSEDSSTAGDSNTMKNAKADSNRRALNEKRKKRTKRK